MKNLFGILTILIVASGCESDIQEKATSDYPVRDTFEIYSKALFPERKNLIKETVVVTYTDTLTEFRNYRDKDPIHYAGFRKSGNIYEINTTRLKEDSDCYTTTGPFTIQLSDTAIDVYKVEYDCYYSVDEEGAMLYVVGIGRIGACSYAWGMGMVMDSLYGHPLSKYAHEIRDSLLGPYFDLVSPYRAAALPKKEDSAVTAVSK